MLMFSSNQWSNRLQAPTRDLLGTHPTRLQLLHRPARASARCAQQHSSIHDDEPTSSAGAACTTSSRSPRWVALAAAALITMSPAAPALANGTGLGPDNPVLDNARLIATEKRQQLADELVLFERETGWRVRAYTTYGNDGRPTDDQLRAAWKPDARSVVINFDASNPNLINFVYLGDEVIMKLRRPWWFELQGRYGNLFFIREQGEQAAVVNTLSVLTQCLGAPEGCKVVPGLSSEQYGFTLALSIAGGIIAGGVSRLEPTGWVQSQWTWLIIFSPLWASLFVNFGLGPVVSRTSDLLPVLGNTAAFLAAAASPHVLYRLWNPPSAQPPRPPTGTRQDATSSSGGTAPAASSGTSPASPGTEQPDTSKARTGQLPSADSSIGE